LTPFWLLAGRLEQKGKGWLWGAGRMLSLLCFLALSEARPLDAEAQAFFEDREPLLGAVAVALLAICLTVLLMRPSAGKRQAAKESSGASASQRAGVLAIEVAFPADYVECKELERVDGVSPRLYTSRRGQSRASVPSDREDATAMALTAVAALLEKYGVAPQVVGRLDVVTSASSVSQVPSKSAMMQLFEGSGNLGLEGSTTIGAKDGGLSAVLDAATWVEARDWNGKLAVVVVSDVVVPEHGRVGAAGGAVAVLIGRDAPLEICLRSRRSLTLSRSTSAKQVLAECYPAFAEHQSEKGFTLDQVNHVVIDSGEGGRGEAERVLGWLGFLDARRHPSAADQELLATLNRWLSAPVRDAEMDEGLDKVLKASLPSSVQGKLSASCELLEHVGGGGAFALLQGLASLLNHHGDAVVGQSILAVACASGAGATMLRFTGRAPRGHRFTLRGMREALALGDRLRERNEVTPLDLNFALESRTTAPGQDQFAWPVARLLQGSFYRVEGGEYTRKPRSATVDPSVRPVRPGPPPAVAEATPEVSPSPNGLGRPAEQPGHRGPKSSLGLGDVVVCGVSAGLPTCRGSSRPMFDPQNLERLITGENCISVLTHQQLDSLIDKNVVQVKKQPDGTTRRFIQTTREDCVKLAAQLSPIDLTQYGVDKRLADTMDSAAQVALAAGLEALRDAGIVRGGSSRLEDWRLPEDMRDSTGVIYASSFPALDAALGEVMRYCTSKSTGGCSVGSLVRALRRRLQHAQGGILSEEDEHAFRMLEASAALARQSNPKPYEFDRKFLFKVLVLGNAQLAQVVGARGPNTQTNAACAGTTQAIAMAEDMMAVGRCERVIVISGDNASSDTLLPWLANGFRALGAASIAGRVADAALPFAGGRNGMLLGAGAVGLVLETRGAFLSRAPRMASPRPKCRILATQYSNSAYHGAALDRKHIASELNRFLNAVQAKFGLGRDEIARQGCYLSHETCTHASPSSSCASNEIGALRDAFGDDLRHLVLINTKGFTGHPMGVSFEDVCAIEVLQRGRVPPTANFTEPDPYLGDINVSSGGKFSGRFALRFAAGFGSHVAFALYESLPPGGEDFGL